MLPHLTTQTHMHGASLLSVCLSVYLSISISVYPRWRSSTRASALRCGSSSTRTRRTTSRWVQTAAGSRRRSGSRTSEKDEVRGREGGGHEPIYVYFWCCLRICPPQPLISLSRLGRGRYEMAVCLAAHGRERITPSTPPLRKESAMSGVIRFPAGLWPAGVHASMEELRDVEG